MNPQACRCSCGSVTFDVVGPALFRILCHCTLCQRYNSAPFADVVVYAAKSVTKPAPGLVSYETYKPPPNVLRGKCTACGAPAIEVFEAPMFPKLTMVPVKMLNEAYGAPPPRAHIFYDKRLADADDALPKHSGFLSSQLAFGRYLIGATLFRT